MATTTTTTTPTGWAADAAYSNWQRAQQIANTPYAQYPGNMLAGWDQAQAVGYNSVLNNAGIGQPAMQQAQNFATQSGAFQPQQVQGGGYTAAQGVPMNTAAASAGPAQQMAAATGNAQTMGRGEVRDVQAGSFPGANLGQYMNPYVDNVVNTTLGQLGRQNDILQNQANARASAAGAFGGSRQAVMNSENNRNFMDTAANTSANLYNTGFNNAQQAIQADQNRAMQAGQLNQAADMTVGQANLANRQQMEMANLSNQQQSGLQNMLQGNEMARYNAGNQQTAYSQTAAAHTQASIEQARAQNEASQYGLDQSLKAQLANQGAGLTASQNQLQAANALNGMGLDAQTYNLNNAKAAFDMGAQRQGFDQSVYDNAYNQWAQQQNYPLTQLGVLQNGLNGYSSGTTQTSPYYSNTGAQIASGVLGAGALGAGILQNGSQIASGASSLWNGLKSWF